MQFWEEMCLFGIEGIHTRKYWTKTLNECGNRGQSCNINMVKIHIFVVAKKMEKSFTHKLIYYMPQINVLKIIMCVNLTPP